MSTAAVTPEIPAAAAPVTVANTAAEILASHAAEKAQPATPAEVPAAPTPVAPVAEASKPYEFTRNADGTVHIKLNEGGQEFKGTEEEVWKKVLESRVEANRYINELKTKAETPAAPAPIATTPAAPQTWVPDEALSVSALNGMLTGGNFGDAVGIGLAQMFGTNDPQQVKQAIGEIIQLSAELKGQRAISEFAQKAPDFPWAEANTTLLLKELQARGLPATTDNLVFTHQALKGMGKYQAVAPAAATADTPNPAPPNAGNPPSQSAEQEQARLMSIPLAQLEAEIRAGK